jgi:hypothetical protein
MRSAKLTFVLVGLSAALMAADPFVGTWKLDAAKSKYKTGTPPKEQTATSTESGSDLDVTISGTMVDGNEIMSHYTVPAQGGEGKIIQSPYEAASGKRIGPNEREVRYSKGGKVVLTTHSKVAADGKTLTVNVKGTDAQGRAVDAVVVYEKQ